MSHRLLLKRFCYASWGVYGHMVVHGRRILTAEKPWLDNVRYISCIPEGTYKLALDPFRGEYDAPLLLNVPGRDQIQIHRGNGPSDVDGCIVVGWRQTFYADAWGIGPSGTAFSFLMEHWPFDEIEIINGCKGV